MFEKNKLMPAKKKRKRKYNSRKLAKEIGFYLILNPNWKIWDYFGIFLKKENKIIKGSFLLPRQAHYFFLPMSYAISLLF